MGRLVDREVLVGFIAETKGYLPEVLKGIESFRVDLSEAEKLEEAHRYVHTIKGASSMVGLSALSHIAYQFEECLEEVAAGTIALSPEAIMLFVNLLAEIEQYLDAALGDATQDVAFLIEATRTVRRLRGLPLEEDDAAIERLLAELGRAPSDEAGKQAAAGFDSAPSEELQAALYHRAADFDDAATRPEPAVSSQKDIPSELVEIFAMEAEDHLRNMSLSLPALEQDPENKDLLQGIRRSAHSLKGTAAMVGFQEITQLSHRMEDLLDLLYDDELKINAEIMGLLLTSTYALEDMAAGKSDPSALARLYGSYAVLLEAAGADIATQRESSVEFETPVESPAEPSFFEGVSSFESEAPGHEPQSLARESAAQIFQPTEPATPEETSTPVAQRRGQVVRVPIERLDELVQLVSELVITRTAFEQSLRDFAREVEELQGSSERLRRVSSKLETEYEASTLGGGRPWMIGPSVPGAPSGILGRVPAGVSPLANYNSYGFDDLEFDRYTEFHLLSRELSETTTDIQSVGGAVQTLLGDFESYLTRQGRLYSEIQDKLMRARMVPLGTLSARLHRTVRTVADKQGKRVDLVLEGEATELDKTVLEEMADPLLHLLRNAVDHGMEPPELRQVRGKPPKGVIRLRAYNEGTQIVIRIVDDGAGIDPETLRVAAVRNGYASATVASEMSNDELMNFLFHPGFSTRQEVSEVSGRGVGLDIVRATVHRLKGSIVPASEPGLGTSFTIRLPMTLAITRALLVKAHGETFAVPIGAVTQILRLETEDVDQVGKEPILRVGEQFYPILFLGKALGLKQPADESTRRPPVLITSVEGKHLALVVDQLLGGREIAVKNLGTHLRRVQGISGATLMGDGTVVLILNPADLMREPARVAPRVRGATGALTGPLTEQDRETLAVMVVDDSPSVRRIVSNLIKNAGWKPVQAKDGLEALEQLHHSASVPDVILLDIEMPRMDGYELLSTLRAQENFRDLPVVMLTSRAGQKHRQKAFDLGATEYLVKPYTDETLLELVRRLGKKK